jgi:5-methylcytosine-specific restriction endonuclease McrA
MRIDTREEYEALLARGIDALYDTRFPMEIHLRREIQKERFGGNDAEGNAKFYRYCLHHFPLVCENCGRPINHPTATNVSHILTRGAHPEMAFDCRNINILCWQCHNWWEHKTTRNRLRLWFVEKNERTIEQLKQEYNDID